MWEYRCRVLSVYDGDSLKLEVDLGFGATMKLKDPGCRLLDIDTPEIRGPERSLGLEAKQFVLDWIAEREDGDDWPFICRTVRDDATGKYGRYLVDLRARPQWVDENVRGIDPDTSLVEALKDAGHDTGDWRGW